MSYADITFADEYFRKRAFSTAWAGDEKGVYLETAAQQIADYCLFEDEYGDPMEFSDSDAPEWLKRANCEQALYLLNLGKDPTQADKKTTLGISSTDGTVFDKSFAADVLCLNCRRILENHGGILSGDAVADDRGKISSGWVVK